MKLRFAFLLLTCASLFPQGNESAEARCFRLCQNNCGAAADKCLKSAKTDKDKKDCATSQTSCLSSCRKTCHY
jgi:hypothetical protein